MADAKISALPAATTPLTGTELVPLVQSGVTKKAAVSDLTAGRAISATQVTVSTGNVIIGASGQGIDFSATANSAGMTSELLDDYEEGTWTPTLPNGGTLLATQARYVKVGQQVTVTCFIQQIAPTNNASDFLIGGLPFANGVASTLYFGGAFGYVGDSDLTGWLPITGSNFSYIYFTLQGSTARRTNAQYLTAASGSADEMILTITYFAAT